MQILEVESKADKIIEQIVGLPKYNELEQQLKSHDPKIIFPVCGKRCYNTICHTRNKKVDKAQSEYAIAQSWENDGNDLNMSSIDVLIEWLTTEENATNYFGGLDIDGKTSSNRKESYHHIIRDLIKDENGSDRSSESIRSKIIRVMQSYKEASERMNMTGNGLEGIQYTSFQEYIVKSVCKYFFELDPILKDRPNVTPWATNEDDDEPHKQ